MAFKRKAQLHVYVSFVDTGNSNVARPLTNNNQAARPLSTITNAGTNKPNRIDICTYENLIVDILTNLLFFCAVNSNKPINNNVLRPTSQTSNAGNAAIKPIQPIRPINKDQSTLAPYKNELSSSEQ